MTRWTLTWQWGGRSGVDDVEVTWAERAAIDSPEPPERSATIVLRPAGLDVLAWLADSASRTVGWGRLARVTSDGVSTAMLVGPWRGVECDDGVIRLTLGDDVVADDSVPWPGAGSVTRYDGFRGGAEVFFEDHPGEFANSTLEYALVTRRFSNFLFQVVYRQRPQVWGPIVFGAPGTTSAYGAPAYLIDEQAQDYGDGLGDTWRVLIARHACVATTVRLWARPANDPEILSLDGHGTDGAGLYDIYTTTDADLGTYSYVSIPVPTLTGATFAGTLPSVTDSMYTSWTEGEALPGGAGQVLVTLLSVSALRCDLAAWQAAADVLDRYELALYVVEQVQPAELARQILALLPCSMVHTYQGLAPQLHPWWDPAATGIPVEEGRGFARASPIGMPDLATAAASVRYGHPAESSQSSQTLRLDATSSAYLAAAVSYGALRLVDRVIEAPAVWASATAQRIADDAVRLGAPGRTVAYLADPGLYGPGATLELRVGMAVRLTDAHAHIGGQLCYVAGMEWATDQIRVDLVMSDDLLGAR